MNGLTLAAALGLLVGCGTEAVRSDAHAGGSAVMFRAGPEHAGAYDGRPLEAFGGLAWRVQTRGAVVSTPAVAGELVYIGSGDGNLYALDRWTGEPRWTFDAGSAVASSPAVGGGLVFFGARDNTFQALDAATGEPRWSVETGPDLPFGWGYESGDVYTSSPVRVGERVLFGSGDGHVYSLGAARGDIHWRFETGGRVRSTPAVVDGIVYAGSADGSLYAIDLETGRQRWRFDTEGRGLDSGDYGYDRRTIQSSPAVTDQLVVFGARDGFLYAVDRRTGRLRWRFDHRISWVNSSPAVAEGMAYVGTSDGRFVHAVELETGAEAWRFETTSSVWSSPAVIGDRVYVCDGSGALHALDRATGEARWRYRTGQRILSSPVPADGMLFFGDHGGGVYAVRGADEPLRRAVFWDSAYADLAWSGADRAIRDGLAARDYRVLDAGALEDFMLEQVRRSGRSVVVFAMDRVPETVGAIAADSVLFRRYLDAGGKIVWVGVPPFLWRRNRDAAEVDLRDIDRGATERLLGVNHAAANFDRIGVRPTEEGRSWGLRRWWLDAWSVAPEAVTKVLALDDLGLASAWHQEYGGPPGTGFVRVGAQIRGARGVPDLVNIQVAAEYLPIDRTRSSRP